MSEERPVTPQFTDFMLVSEIAHTKLIERIKHTMKDAKIINGMFHSPNRLMSKMRCFRS
jgi:hypothetical protein